MKTAVILIVCVISAAYGASLDNRIIAGQIAADGQFPYEVSLKVYGSHNCGASILSETRILTAAHCVKDVPATAMTIVTGTNTLDAGGDVYKVAFYVHHEGFTWENPMFDLAVIKLASKISFNKKVQPIGLNTSPVPSGSDLIISGWGVESYPSNVPSNVLKFFKLKAWSTKECQQKFDTLGYKVNDLQICAFSKNGEGVCSGDSGSPLVFDGKVAGIASWVQPCGVGYPDVYTRVSMYVDWIKRHMV